MNMYEQVYWTTRGVLSVDEFTYLYGLQRDYTS